jgi:outer membrane protein assembly factor BamB
VLEPGRVYISFGSYGTACLDTATRKLLWERRDLPCRHYRGPGSSPILFEDLLILTFDGVDVQYVVALDKKSGKNIWKTDRTAAFNDLDAQGKPMTEGDYRKAFSTPLIVDVNGKTEMLSAGSRAAFGYDPRTGRELWKVNHPGYSSAGRPVYGQGLAFIMTGQGQPGLMAVRAGGEGDVSKTNVVWKTNQGAPKMPSPLLIDKLLYMISDDGGVTCLEGATGNPVWKERIGGTYCASPICADERIYIPSTQGKTTVLKAGPKFELLATNTLEAGCMASPAVSGKSLFLRTKTHVYRIEAAAEGKK